MATAPDVQEDRELATRSPERLVHLVLKAEWPRALCGFIVTERFGDTAPGMDRCADCLRIAAGRSLGRPGWL